MNVLRDSDNRIISYGDGDGSDWSLAPGQTVEILPGRPVDYADRFRLEPDSFTLPADGVSVVTVLVTTSEPVDVIDVAINDHVEQVAIIDGVGSIELSADVPGILLVKPADETLYAACGVGQVAIEAI